jgi:predicted regulator of Ras-like GTPase activity (Roadblock/LC7/MglB family)
MTIPFIDFFNKVRDLFATKTSAPTTMAGGVMSHSQKRAGEKLSKTVLPSTKRPSATADPFHASASKTAPFMASAALRRLATSPGSRTRDLPRALAMALEPKFERAISLQLSDFLDQIPADYIKPVEVIDANRAVSLKASEIEKGMPEQHPTISLTSLYQQLPEIFLRTVAPADATRVPLPYEKVLEQFSNVRVRDDQERDENIPQLETPILQATIEDTKRFGTRIEPVETSSHPMPLETATAETLASAEPEPAVSEVSSKSAAPTLPHPVISLHAFEPKPKVLSEPEPFLTARKPDLPKPDTDQPKQDVAQQPKQDLPKTESKDEASSTASPSRTGIPFQFPPNGTGAPASERVPASCGPPVPTLSPTPPESKHIPFEVSDETVALKPSTPEKTETPPIVSAPAKPAFTPDLPELKIETTPPTAVTPPEPKQAAPETPTTKATPEFKTNSPTLKMETAPPAAIPPAAEKKQATPEIEKLPDAFELIKTEALNLAEPLESDKAVKAEDVVETHEAPEADEIFEADEEFEVKGKSTTASDSAPTISLALKPLLQNVPAFQLAGDPSSVGDGARVTFPLALIKSQLGGGRVVVPPKTFCDALPRVHRSLFLVDPAETPVSLPLQEVLRNLPDGALKRRDDQQRFFPRKDFETPIARHAKEDAKRFQPRVPDLPKPTTVEPKAEIKPESKAPPAEKIDGKQVVAAACQLDGVEACELMFPDGLSLAGNFPPEIGADGLCAMAPTLLQRVDAHTHDTKLGSLVAMTAHCAQSVITFFMKENICLAALHKDKAALKSETRARLDELAEKLSRTFAQPEKSHVDH